MQSKLGTMVFTIIILLNISSTNGFISKEVRFFSINQVNTIDNAMIFEVDIDIGKREELYGNNNETTTTKGPKNIDEPVYKSSSNAEY